MVVYSDSYYLLVDHSGLYEMHNNTCARMCEPADILFIVSKCSSSTQPAGKCFFSVLRPRRPPLPAIFCSAVSAAASSSISARPIGVSALGLLLLLLSPTAVPEIPLAPASPTCCCVYFQKILNDPMNDRLRP